MQDALLLFAGFALGVRSCSDFLAPQVGGACDRMHGYRRRNHARHNGQLLPIIPEDLHMAAGHAVMAA